MAIGRLDIPQIKSSGGLRGGFDNPFKNGSSNRIRNSSGSNYRQSMNSIKSMGGGIQSLSNSMSRIGNTLMGQFNNTFVPAISRAQELADVNEQQLVDEASLDIGNAYDKAQDIQTRNLSRYGISPNSGKFQGQMLDLNLLRAAADAGARNKARIQARDLTFGRNMQVAGMSAPLAGQAASVYSSAGNMLGNAAGMHNLYANNMRRDAENQAAWNSYSNG